MFFDIESGEIVTVAQLETEFKALQTAQPEEYQFSFADYIRNCTSKNGTLIPIYEVKA